MRKNNTGFWLVLVLVVAFVAPKFGYRVAEKRYRLKAEAYDRLIKIEHGLLTLAVEEPNGTQFSNEAIEVLRSIVGDMTFAVSAYLEDGKIEHLDLVQERLRGNLDQANLIEFRLRGEHPVPSFLQDMVPEDPAPNKKDQP